MHMHDTTNQMRGSLRNYICSGGELEEKQILRQINSKTFDIFDFLPVCSQLIKVLWAHGNIDTYSSASVLRFPCDIMSKRIVAPCCQSASMLFPAWPADTQHLGNVVSFQGPSTPILSAKHANETISSVLKHLISMPTRWGAQPCVGESQLWVRWMLFLNMWAASSTFVRSVRLLKMGIWYWT